MLSFLNIIDIFKLSDVRTVMQKRNNPSAVTACINLSRVTPSSAVAATSDPTIMETGIILRILEKDAFCIA